MRAPAIALFHATFAAPPQAVASAPGRVNLVGEHTDYNGGPVLPVAIRDRTTAAVGPAGPEMLELVSTLDGKVERLNWKSDTPTGGGWAAYAAGVVRELAALDALPADGGGGVRVAVASAVPVGAGLASSAALTVALAKAVALLAGPRVRLSPRQLAGVAFRAEHDHVGVRCGIMDQTVAALAKPNHALLIECASGETRQILLPRRGRILLVDTGVRHELGTSAFNQRRVECEAAVRRLKVELPELMWLASWPTRWLYRLKKALPQPLRSRAVHVVSETARTRFAAQLLAQGRVKRFGELLYESHESCRRLYECSSPELDLVVAAAKRAGALGARLTGAGWGGAALVLTDAQREAAVVAAIRKAFHKAYERDPPIIPVQAGGGARRERVR